MGNNIRHFRELSELTLEDLATDIGLSASYLSRMEREGEDDSRNVNTKHLELIAKKLGVSPAQLIDEVSESATGTPQAGSRTASTSTRDSREPLESLLPEFAQQVLVELAKAGTNAPQEHQVRLIVAAGKVLLARAELARLASIEFPQTHP